MTKILGLLCLLINFVGFSQQTTTLFFHLDHKIEKVKTLNDSSAQNSHKQDAFLNFQMQGYVGLTIIDSTYKTNETHYWLNFEKKFKKIILTDSTKTASTSFNESYNVINKRLTVLQNSGYPFAKLKITHQKAKQNKLHIYYKIDSSDYVEVEKIHLRSEDKYNTQTILNILDLEVGEPYNENKLKKITNLFAVSGLYKTIREPEVLFKKGKAEIFIYFKKEKSSNADGYVGILQDKNTQKVSLNGYINLHLKNALNRGELVNLNWKSNPDKTQNLKFNFEYPYIFNTPIGVDTDLNLHKQDTSFIKSLANFGLNYQHAFYQFGIFNQIESSSILNQNSIYQIRDYSKNTIGLKIILRPQLTGKLQFYSPTITMKGGFFNYKSDSITSITTTSNLSYEVALRQKFNFLNYFSFTNQSGIQGMNSSYELSRNELVYFGGLKSVRGFYELELVGNQIFTSLNEIQYQPISALSFKLIYDYSSYRNSGNYHTNSFGFGFGLLNENSILEIIIANGVVNDATLDFSNTKIHIGFSSNF